MKIADISIARPVSTFMLMVAMVVFGFIAFARLPINLLPDISYPTLTVRTDFPGTAPYEVERLVSKRIEDAVGVIPGVVRVSSVSRPSRSDVTVEFAWKTNMDFAALDIRERLDTIVLPDDAKQPMLLRFDPSLDPIMRIGLTGEDSLVALRLMAEDEIKPALESLSTQDGEGGGVAAVKVSGGLEEEIHVDVHEAKLSVLGIPMRQVVTRLEQENVNLTGGTLKDGEAEYLVRTLNEFRTVDEIGDIVLAMRDDRPVLLKDVARVRKTHKERTVITRIDGRESVELAIYKEADANTVSVAKLVKERLGVLQQNLQRRASTVKTHVVSDQSWFIQQSIDEVLHTAMMGGILAVAVLYLFLRHFGSTVIVGIAIPLSVVATFFFMYWFGVTLNVMSLGGLALGVGMLVDNAIVVLESIARFRDRGLSGRQAASKGTDEVGRAVVASTLTTVCVFFPIIFVQGIAGQLFQDQALTVTWSLLVSLFVALTCIPMLASLRIWGLTAVTADDGGRGGAPSQEPGSRPTRVIVSVLIVTLFGMALTGTFVISGLGSSIASRLGIRHGLLEGWRGGYRWFAVACVWGLFFVLSAWLSGGIRRIFDAARAFGVGMRKGLFAHMLRLIAVGFLTLILLLVMREPEWARSWLPDRPDTGMRYSRYGGGGEQSMRDLAVGFSHAAIDRFSSATWGAGALAAVWAYLLLRAGGGLVVAAVVKLLWGELTRVLHILLWLPVWLFNALYAVVERFYPRVIEGALRNKFVVVAGSVLGLWVTVQLAGGLGSELIPELSQGQINVDFQMPVGTPIDDTLAAALRMERGAQEHPDTASVYTIVGTTGQTGGYASDELEHIGQLSVRLRPGAGREDEEAAVGKLRERFLPIPALTFKFSRPALFTFATPVEVEVGGYNLLKLERVANEVARLLQGMRGLTDVRTNLVSGNPEFQILFDREKTARLGLDIASIASIIRNNVEGEVATEFRREDRLVDIRVRANREAITGVQALERLTVNPQGGTPIPLAAVARVIVAEGPNEISRIGGERVALVTANLRGRDLKSAVAEIEERLPQLRMPRDFDVRVSGQSREMAAAFSSMRFAIALAAFLVYLVMASQFESLVHPFVIMFAIPFGLIGVVIALCLTGIPISVIVLIGVVVLAGIVVNDAIVLVDCINNRRRDGLPRRDAIVEAGRLRLRPILMTTATTVLGLLPMALGLGEGAELRTPLAIALIGGMISSTLLTLVFVPTVYDMVEAAKDAVVAAFARLRGVVE